MVVVVEKVQRNRKNRGEDQKNEARRKTRNQDGENRDQVKDRKRMNEVMTRQAAVPARMIGKIHLMMRKIQVWNFLCFFLIQMAILGSERSRSNSPRRKRQRDRSRSSRSRSRSSSGSSGWDHGAGYKGNGGYKGKNWRGGGRGRGRGRKSFRNTEPSTLRGRGYWRPNYIAYGRNIFPGGESSETHSDSSRSFTTSSSSRSSTPEHYKDTPDHSPEPKPRAKTPVKEDGLMDKIQKGIEQKEIERINAIMAQLEQQGKDNAAKINAPRSNHGFVRTMEEKDIFADTDETPQLRKDFKSRADIAKETKGSSPLDPMKKKPKLFDYDDAGLDKGTLTFL